MLDAFTDFLIAILPSKALWILLVVFLVFAGLALWWALG